MKRSLSTYSTFKKMLLHNPDIHLLPQEEVNAVQQVLLTMMDDIHSVCRENDLHYVMSGGCALGAVRHGGFIPWDDDIDICMPRKDYDQIRQCMMQRFPEKYYVQEIKACEQYDLSFMKIRLNGTVFCEHLDSEPEKAGVFIDVFAVENVADNPFVRNVQWLLSDGMQFICSCIRIRKKRKILLEMAGESRQAVRAIRIKSVLSIPFSVIPFRRWLLWTEKVLRMNHNEQSEYISVSSGVKHFKGEMYPREWFFPEREMEFQGRQYCVMAEIEKYLGKMFGDYQKIPPVEERERHALLAFSLD